MATARFQVWKNGKIVATAQRYGAAMSKFIITSEHSTKADDVWCVDTEFGDIVMRQR